MILIYYKDEYIATRLIVQNPMQQYRAVFFFADLHIREVWIRMQMNGVKTPLQYILQICGLITYARR